MSVEYASIGKIPEPTCQFQYDTNENSWTNPEQLPYYCVFFVAKHAYGDYQSSN